MIVDNNELKPVAYWVNLLAISGFVAVAFAQVSNMILARANAGEVPPFSLACIRWAVIALGLSPFLIAKPSQLWPVLATGFMGTFLCGAPVYIAGISTCSLFLGWPVWKRSGGFSYWAWVLRCWGYYLSFARGRPRAEQLRFSMGRSAHGRSHVRMVWIHSASVSRCPNLPFFGRVSLFAAVGAVTSLPLAIQEAIVTPQRVFSWHALVVYLFAGVVPGILAYGGFAYLGSKFGSIRASLVLYVGPVASALLSFLLLGEPPGLVHLYGGAFILAGVWLCLRK